MKRKDNSIIKKIGNAYMILPLSDHNISVDVVLRTNEVGALIYNELENEATLDDIVSKIMSEYSVEKEKCESDVLSFINQMKEKGLI